MDLFEKIANEPFLSRIMANFKCPFKEVEKNNNNKSLPKCGAKVLGENRGEQTYKYGDKIKIILEKTSYDVYITAHHVIPCGSWAYTEDGKKCAKTKLWQWIDKDAEDSQVSESVGYDVNNGNNGVYLPSPYSEYNRKHKSGRWKEENFPQEAYANAVMKITERQFHIVHSDYIDFVSGVLDKIAEKLKPNKNNEICPYCGHENCEEYKKYLAAKEEEKKEEKEEEKKEKKEKKYPPAQHLKKRLDGVSGRLREYLIGGTKKWNILISTSRFALVYKETIEKTTKIS